MLAHNPKFPVLHGASLPVACQDDHIKNRDVKCLYGEVVPVPCSPLGRYI